MIKTQNEQTENDTQVDDLAHKIVLFALHRFELSYISMDCRTN